MEEMPGWLDRLRKPILSRVAEAPLRGAPATRRLKNYAALSGYVYEYFFEGYRDVRATREYVFSVSGDRKSWFTFQVRLAGNATAAWELERGCVLGDRERYAIAKLALFSVFDERANPDAIRGCFDIAPDIAVELLQKLNL